MSASQSDAATTAASQASDTPASAFIGLHHVGILCADLDKALDFYCGVLGLEVNDSRPNQKLPYGGKWLWIGQGEGSRGGMIHLMVLPNPDPTSGRPEHGGRDRHTCIEVADVAPLQAALDRAGIPYTMSHEAYVWLRELWKSALALHVVRASLLSKWQKAGYSGLLFQGNAWPLRFDARNFLEKMRNKNILFAGDSLMWEGFFPSFLCQVHRASPARKVNYDSRFKQTTWTVDEFKVTLIHVWSPFLMDFSSDSKVLKRLKVEHPALGDTAVNLFQPDPNWTLLLPHVHLVLLQSATHWPNADKWLRRFFTDRKWQLLSPQPDTFQAYTGAMDAVRKRLSRKPSSKGGRYVAYFLSAPPRLAGCQNTVTLSPPDQVAYLRSKNAQSKVWFRTQKQLFGRKNSRVRLLDITHPSLARADAMIGSQGTASMDCLHPCLPGLPDNWVDLFYAAWLADKGF
ncbi:unnamed protein product [Closterium sp. Yama58-4]|nr:unnamed protein product [Closterium sp. Yama58-4]